MTHNKETDMDVVETLERERSAAKDRLSRLEAAIAALVGPTRRQLAELPPVEFKVEAAPQKAPTKAKAKAKAKAKPPASRPEAILSALGGRAMAPSQVSDALGVYDPGDRKRLNIMMCHMVKSGHLRRLDYGLYSRTGVNGHA